MSLSLAVLYCQIGILRCQGNAQYVLLELNISNICYSFLCPRARNVWMNLGLDTTIPEASAEFSEGHQLLEFLLSANQARSVVFGVQLMIEIFSISFWYLWWACRQQCCDEQVQNPERPAII